MSSQPENPQHPADDRYAAGGQYDSGDQHAPGGQYGPEDGAPADEPAGPPYRAIAMVLLAAVVLAVGIGLVQLFSGDDESAPTAGESTTQTQPTEPQATGQEAEPAPATPAPDGQAATAVPAPGGQDATGPQGGQATADVPPLTSIPVQVFNNSNVTGLAGRTGETLRESGFAVADVSNLPSNQGVVPESTAYYGTGPGEQQAAEAIAAQLGIPARPRPAELAVETPGVIVIVTQDLDR